MEENNYGDGAQSAHVDDHTYSREQHPFDGEGHDNTSSHNRNEGSSFRQERGGSVENKGSNLYVSNLSFETTDDSLRAVFEKFGEIQSASVVKEPASNVSRGFGFVNFADAEAAKQAQLEMNGNIIDNRTVKVEHARRSAPHEKTPGRYLGPPQLSTRPSARAGGGGRDFDRGRDRGGYGGDRDGYDRSGGGYDRGGGRDYRGRDRSRERGGWGGGARDDYPRRDAPMPYPPAVYRGGSGGYDRDERGAGGYHRGEDYYDRAPVGPPPREQRGYPPNLDDGYSRGVPSYAPSDLRGPPGRGGGGYPGDSRGYGGRY